VLITIGAPPPPQRELARLEVIEDQEQLLVVELDARGARELGRPVEGPALQAFGQHPQTRRVEEEDLQPILRAVAEDK